MSQFHTSPENRGQDRIRETTDRVRETARAKADELKREAEQQALSQKSQLCDRGHVIAKALRSAGGELQSQGESFGMVAEIAGDKVDELTRYIADRSPGELVADVEQVARRQPWLFMGGAFVVGFVAGRFMKAGMGAQSFEPRDDYGLGGTSDYALTGVPERPRRVEPQPGIGTAGVTPGFGGSEGQGGGYGFQG